MRVGYSPVRLKHTVNHCAVTNHMQHFKKGMNKELSKGFVFFQITSSTVSALKDLSCSDLI